MVVADFRAAVAQRDASKATLEALEQEILAHPGTALEAAIVDVYINQSAQLCTDFLNFHKILHVNAPVGTDLDPHNIEHNILFKRAARAHAAFKGIKMTFPVQPPTALPYQTTVPSVRLPALELPSFGGNLQEWVAFRDIFEAAVGSSASLSKSQKLTYLKTCLVGEAAKHIRSLVLSDANYDIAWKALTDRYSNERELLFCILKRLTNQSNISSSAASVRSLIDTTKECTRSLEVLRIPVEHWGAILIYIMFQKLDSQSKELWEQQLKDSRIPDLDDMYTFLEQRARALSASSTSHTRSQQPAKGQQQRQPAQSFHLEPSASCKLECGGNTHPLFVCNKFKTMTVSERITNIKRLNICFNCLSEGHNASSCSSKHSCKICRQRHHTMLHQSQQGHSTQHNRQSSQQYNESSPSVSSHHVQSNSDDLELDMLATAIIRVITEDGTLHHVRALLDGGSPVNVISEACKTRLGLKTSSRTIQLNGLQEVHVGTSDGLATFAITPHFNSSATLTVKALVIPKISKQQPPARQNIKDWYHIKNLRLADPEFNTPAPVDILLGSGVFFSILEGGKIPGPHGAPYAINSSLGWLIGGKYQTHLQEVSSFFTDIDLDNAIKRFWEAESVPEETKLTAEERQCEDHFATTHRRDMEGRFTVSIPFKQPPSTLGDSKSHALFRLNQLEKRLSHHKNPVIQSKRQQQRQEYNKFMEDYESLGHMSVVPPHEVETTNPTYYIPHHFIEKPTSTTTKFRVVFDASAKTTSGLSLNDIQMVGPVIQDSLYSISLRFRTHQIAFTSDIEKMYRQVLIDDKQRDLQRILWRSTPSQPVRVYRLNTISYGEAAASYLATKTLLQLAIDGQNSHPLAAPILKEDTYMDDIQSGRDDVTSAVETIDQLISLCSSAGFPLRKWTSNNEEVLKSIPADLRETKSLIPIDTDHTIKTLGIFWNPQSDNYLFKINFLTECKTYTKRKVLSEMSRIFDPLGWLTPVLITAKIFMQQLWREHHDWDTALPAHLQEKWKSFRTEMYEIEKLTIPRCVIKGTPIRIILCGHSDASTDAYACSIHVCCFYVDQPPETALVTGKSRVAPVDAPTIPRLELCGAVLLATLMSTVNTAMKIKFDELRCYTDSTITLAWINSSPQRWKTYVRRRVQQIHDNIPNATWFHIPGINNPADCASRGISPTSILVHQLWWNGSEEMKIASPLQAIINENVLAAVAQEEKEKRAEVQCFQISTTADSFLHRYSNFLRLVRITAWIRRYFYNITSLKSSPLQLGTLTTAELSNAQTCVIRLTQQHEFSIEIQLLRSKKNLPVSNKILSLSPFLDDDGILRVGGRLKNAPWLTKRKHPILLPKNHHITKTIIMDCHLQHFHGGPQLVSAVLRQRYWIINSKSIIQYVTKKCATCVRHKAATLTQFMGHLPAARVTPSPVFSKCGLDYGGPFTIKPITRSKIELKAYMAIFICFATKAIHLEVVKSLSTSDFIAALRRFISRRGIPTDIFSDCGTNFVGANKVLRDLFSNFRSNSHNNKVANECSAIGIQWHFNPASAPHFGGLWEAGVRSVKHHLTRVVGSARLTYDELETLLIQIEAILNSRPIIPASSDPNDLEAITPAHFLIGRPLTALPDPDLMDLNIGRLDRWQIIQQQQQMFWSRWSKEHISRLQQRPKWMKVSPQIQLGNMVLIKDERLPPLKWKLGRVQQLHPGGDGLTRVVTLRTADGELKRPIHKLCLLPVDNEGETT